MTVSSFHHPSSPASAHWTLDPDGCHLLLELPDSHLANLPVEGARGWVELREGELVGSRISIRLPPRDPGSDGHLPPAGCVFQGSAVRLGAEQEMEIEGQLRVGDRVDPLTLAVIPIRYHRRGDTEYLDLDVRGLLPPSRCGANRVKGRFRILRARPAA